MSLEWFDRVCGDLQDHLESICEEYDQVGQMTIERSAKHPRIEFYVETEDFSREIISVRCSLTPRMRSFMLKLLMWKVGI